MFLSNRLTLNSIVNIYMAPIMFTRIYLNIRKLLVDSCNVEYLVNGYRRLFQTSIVHTREQTEVHASSDATNEIIGRKNRLLIENSRRMPRTRASRGNELDSTEADGRVDAPEAGFGGETCAE